MFIYFIRKNPNGNGLGTDPRNDDVLKIERLGENNLRVSYTERSADGTLVDISLMTYQKFFHYIQRIFWMLTNDDDPFHSVQLIIPGYPTSLMTVGALKANMYTILDTIITTCWQWPAISRGAAAPLRVIDPPPATQ